MRWDRLLSEIKVLSAHKYTATVENSPRKSFDLELPARGVSFQFIRKYGSANKEQIDALGRGWTFTYAKRLVPDASDVLYHDGFWRVHRFAFFSSDGRFLPRRNSRRSVSIS